MPATTESFCRDESMLVGLSGQLHFRHFVKAVSYWVQLADPGGVERIADAHYASRRLHLSQGFDGRWFLDGALDQLSGAAVVEALRRVERELFEHDWADARARVGDAASGRDLRRTPA